MDIPKKGLCILISIMFVGFDWKNSKKLSRNFRNFEALMDLEERAATGKLQIHFLLCKSSLPTVLMLLQQYVNGSPDTIV